MSVIDRASLVAQAQADDARVSPGHDYIENNLKFTLSRESGNQAAAELLPKVASHDPAKAIVTMLGQEKGYNSFMRLGNPAVIEKLRESFPDLPDKPDARTVFAKLRELRNKC